MALEKSYSLHKRGRIWYAQFKLPGGKWTTAKSTKQTTKTRAEAWCIEYLQQGPVPVRENITLNEYSKDFFSWGGTWATDKQVRGIRICRRHCREREDLLRNHILPTLGHLKLGQIDRATIKDLRNALYNNGYAGSTINKVLSALKALLEAAEENNLIRYIPKIERAALNTKHKGILTIDEVRRVFAVQWYDFRAYSANLLAATTGLRLGEILALTLNDINIDEGCIHVRRSWDTRLKIMNQTTKTGRARTIFIPGNVLDEIHRLIDVNPHKEDPESFLFFGRNRTIPVDGNLFTRAFYTSLEKIGIDNQTRMQRNITFHSWRHWLNSLLINAKIPIQKVQSITGHLTAEMSQHYYHLSIDDMGDVLKVQESIFTPADPGEIIN